LPALPESQEGSNMIQYSQWTSFTGTTRIVLTCVLLVIAVVLALAGWRLRKTHAARHGGVVIGIFVAVIWVLSVYILDWVQIAYGLAIHNEVVASGQTAVGSKNPITRFTILFALVVFVLIFVWLRKRYGWKVAIVSAIAGAGAGPVMFEFPFDWIIMWHLNVPDPVALYRWLYFMPLFLFIIATLAICTLTPAARLRRETLFALAVMFLLWAGWAITTGFAYPSSPVPLVFNVTSKLVAAVAGVMIFLPDFKAEKLEKQAAAQV